MGTTETIANMVTETGTGRPYQVRPTPADSVAWAALGVARRNLTEYVSKEATFIQQAHGVSMIVSDDAPNTFDELRRQWLASSGTSITVSSLHCDGTIYLSPTANQQFRFWHDWLHLEHNKPFTLAGELAIGAIHCDAVAMWFGYDSLEYKLMLADTVGQSTYEAVTGKFPADQLAFARAFVAQ